MRKPSIGSDRVEAPSPAGSVGAQHASSEAHATAGLFATLLMSVACAALVGCATSRSEVKLDTPAMAPPGAAVATTPAPARGFAVIRMVKDERVFEQAPGDPSVPSLGGEGAQQATAETKLRAIGRKRNAFGQALGDVLLQSGQTVETVVRGALTEAFRLSGYQVVDAAVAAPAALVVDARIKDCWAWMNPGFWSVTVNTRIATDLAIAGVPGTSRVEVHHQEGRQLVTDGTWIEVAQVALQKWREEAVKKLQTLPPGQ